MKAKLQYSPESYFTVSCKKKGDIHYWATHLGVSEKRIKDAVDKVGPSLEDVQKYLNTIRQYYFNVIAIDDLT